MPAPVGDDLAATGASGAYTGATGWCDSTNTADGARTHVFRYR